MTGDKKLQGKVAVITGGPKGIGLATATLFVRESAYVFTTGAAKRNSMTGDKSGRTSG